MKQSIQTKHGLNSLTIWKLELFWNFMIKCNNRHNKIFWLIENWKKKSWNKNRGFKAFKEKIMPQMKVLTYTVKFLKKNLLGFCKY